LATVPIFIVSIVVATVAISTLLIAIIGPVISVSKVSTHCRVLQVRLYFWGVLLYHVALFIKPSAYDLVIGC
tara:strand:- start:5171 stop:5386 length:216 start_codon:yes stop_codon:yes gene_type:complete